MQQDIILIIVGAAVGFISAVIIELVKNRLEKKRLTQLRKEDSVHSRDDNIRDFLTENLNNRNRIAWLKLIDTPTPSIFRKIIQQSWVGVTTDSNEQDKLKSDSPSIQRTIRLEKKTRDVIYKNRYQFRKTIRKYLLAQTQVIGRDKTCEISIADMNISREHAIVRFESGGYRIYDIGSTSGTYVNNEQVLPTGTDLRDKDIINVGLSMLIFEAINLDTKNERRKKKRKEALESQNNHGSS